MLDELEVDFAVLAQVQEDQTIHVVVCMHWDNENPNLLGGTLEGSMPQLRGGGVEFTPNGCPTMVSGANLIRGVSVHNMRLLLSQKGGRGFGKNCDFW